MAKEHSLQDSLFGDDSKSQTMRPLAYRIRPENLTDYCGQAHIFERYSYLKSQNFPSLILWGPPGTGKTTLAQILAAQAKKELYTFNAVLGGVNELKKIIERAQESKSYFGKEAIIFVDEIHRFNKAQQDALLPYVEQGLIQFIGATTQNPRSSVNRALLSRVQSIELKNLDKQAITNILKRACKKEDVTVSNEIIELIASYSNGDARSALNTLEGVLLEDQNDLSAEQVLKRVHEGNKDYDKDQDRHYDVISAFIKSMRGSDPSAAILYLAIMLNAGEDPVFIARRLVIFASEDIGNADPSALTLATSTLSAVQNIGMPEARINLAHATTYLASTVKSNAAYLAINEAIAYVENNQTIEVPSHLRNHHPDNKRYKYPHNFDAHFTPQDYVPKETPRFYNPSEQGTEKKIKERLSALKK